VTTQWLKHIFLVQYSEFIVHRRERKCTFLYYALFFCTNLLDKCRITSYKREREREGGGGVSDLEQRRVPVEHNSESEKVPFVTLREADGHWTCMDILIVPLDLMKGLSVLDLIVHTS